MENCTKVNIRHITKDILKVIPLRWNIDEVEKAAQKKVYYNVTGATPEDMTYIANTAYYNYRWPKKRCVDYLLSVIGDYRSGREFAYKHYLRAYKQ